MRFAFDPAKAASNLAKHGVAFEAVERFEASGFIDHRLHILIFTVERGLRVISLRKANHREVCRYAET